MSQEIWVHDFRKTDDYPLQIQNCNSTISHFVGQTIQSVEKEGKYLILHFTYSDIIVYDAERICCESRWMHTDDDLTYFTDCTFLGMEVRDGGCDVKVNEPNDDNEYADCEFMEIFTSKGSFTCANYNAHNGYYEGMNISFFAFYKGSERFKEVLAWG